MPPASRAGCPAVSAGEDGNEEEEGAPRLLERVVELEDVAALLFRLDNCLPLREQLVLGCCQMLGAPLGSWLCSNSSLAARLVSRPSPSYRYIAKTECTSHSHFRFHIQNMNRDVLCSLASVDTPVLSSVILSTGAAIGTYSLHD